MSRSADRPFEDQVLQSFGFLLDSGFAVATTQARFVRFQSAAVGVSVFLGRGSFQVGLEIGRLDRAEAFSLHEIFSAFASDRPGLARWQAVDPVELRRGLDQIAATLHERCAELVNGQAAAFETLAARTASMRRAATVEAQFGALLTRADEAWMAKDHGTAADLYEKAEVALGAAQRRRLAYLRSRRTGGAQASP